MTTAENVIRFLRVCLAALVIGPAASFQKNTYANRRGLLPVKPNAQPDSSSYIPINISQIAPWKTAMEPLAALGLASNVFQFIDFSLNLVRDASNIHRSTSGLTAELEDVVVITNSLESYMCRLSPPALSSPAPPDDKALETLVINCHKTCGELKQMVGKIKGKDPSSRRDSFRAAWRSLRAKGKLEELEKRLDRYQSQICGQLVSLLRYGLPQLQYAYASF